jgi:hypothetical protein
MKINTASNNQPERASQTTACWPECVEDSYEQLVATITALVAGEGCHGFVGAKTISDHATL